MPIQRSTALQPLSRQHHGGLLFCLLLKKGVRKNAPVGVMRDFVLDFWQKELQQHFHLEEAILEPFVTDLELKAPMQRMLRDHAQIREAIHLVELQPSLLRIQQVQELVEEHIRFEERHLFQIMETSLSPEVMQQIGGQLADAGEYNCNLYPVRFWE
ncbi:MAG: hemerythrin domain-containing protein [Chitinophagales bacterium]|nr:hemerythrin domain-containing protein [Chitinophagales bacterium]